MPPSSQAPAAPSGCANPWADLEGCGHPGAGNTGPRMGNCPNGLTDNSVGITGKIRITVPDTVISCQRITGMVEIAAGNVTIRDSTVTYNGGGGNGGGAVVVGDGGSGTIERVEINGSGNTHSCVWHQGTSAVVDGIKCHGTTDGVVAWARTAYSATSGDNLTFRNSYLYDFNAASSNGHMDGFQTAGTRNVTIANNTIVMPPAANSAIAIYNGQKNATDISVTGNLLAGAQFTVYASDYNPSMGSPSGGHTVTNVRFTNNRFSTRVSGCVGVWGAWYTTQNAYGGGPTDGWNRSGNVIAETGVNIDGGNPSCR
ncbi:MAG: hypothetical protein ACK5PP_14900 [Acidimicrobiales bacterium]